jgi:adenylosuccinate synthase
MCLGIHEDTGSFTFSSTTAEDYRAAAWLTDQGANHNIIADMLTRELTVEQVWLLNDLTQSATTRVINGIEVVFAKVIRDEYIGDFAVLVHKLMEMENLNCLFALARMEDRIYVVARSRIREVNVGEILLAFGEKPIDFDEVKKAYLSASRKLAPFITNTVVYLHNAIQAGKGILFEGAQGTFLDLDHGTYPYVTSSNTTAGGACTGTGVPPHRIDRVIGVMKAYTTRVGEGPFPTENKEISDMLHAMGREFGSTTGRPRRCGWFDSVATRYSSMINGIDELAITNLDGLDHVEKIKICVAYKLSGKTLTVPPSDLRQLEKCVPVLVELPGWKKFTGDARTFNELPLKARKYLNKIASLTGPKLSLVSVGADREQTIRL